jgi:hypothetical protein
MTTQKLTLLQDREDGKVELDDTGQQAEPSGAESPTFSSGSLPIDIVNPGSSFRIAQNG